MSLNQTHLNTEFFTKQRSFIVALILQSMLATRTYTGSKQNKTLVMLNKEHVIIKPAVSRVEVYYLVRNMIKIYSAKP